MRGGIEGALPARPADRWARTGLALDREALPSARAESDHSLYREWAEEQARARWQAPEEEEQVIASINTKLEPMHDRGLAAMSPRTRAAQEEFKQLEALDKADGYSPYNDPEHPNYIDREHAARKPDPVPLPPPDWAKREGEDKKLNAPGDPRWQSIRMGVRIIRRIDASFSRHYPVQQQLWLGPKQR